MGQKANPVLLRVHHGNSWSSRWFDERTYAETVREDFRLREALMNRMKQAGISSVEIERSINSVKIIAYVSRPGMVIGRGGTGLEELKKFVAAFFKPIDKKHAPKVDIRIEPVKDPNLDAQLVARNIGEMMLRRLPYKRILVQSADRVMNSGAQGVRILLAGRVGGAEISRREKIQVGKVPLSTIRSDIDYASVPALTKKGYVGVKVWIHKPEEK